MGNWKRIKLLELCQRITKGTTPSTIGGDYSDNGVNYIKSESLSYSKRSLDKSKFTKISEETNKKLFRSILKENDILLSIAGAFLGKTAIVLQEDLPANTNQAVAIIRTNPKYIDYKFLYYFLNQKEIIIKINKSSAQSAQPNFNLTDLGNLFIDFPEKIEEQQAIADVLSSFDDKIELNNKIIKNLEEQIMSVYNELIKDTPEFPLGDLIENIETGSRPKGGAEVEGVPSIGAEKIEKFGLYDYSSEKYVNEEYYNNMKRGHVKSGDVLLYKDGAYTGKVSMALDGFPYKKCAINEHVFILRTKELKFQSFLYCSIKNEIIRQKIFTLACGKAAQPGLNQKELFSVHIPTPKENKIIEFENIVKPMMKRIAAIALENLQLTKTRDYLLPKLMNGEIKVTDVK